VGWWNDGVAGWWPANLRTLARQAGRIFPSVTERKCACEKVRKLGKTLQIEHPRSGVVFGQAAFQVVDRYPKTTPEPFGTSRLTAWRRRFTPSRRRRRSDTFRSAGSSASSPAPKAGRSTGLAHRGQESFSGGRLQYGGGMDRKRLPTPAPHPCRLLRLGVQRGSTDGLRGDAGHRGGDEVARASGGQVGHVHHAVGRVQVVVHLAARP
jgi:hypothetical protein